VSLEVRDVSVRFGGVAALAGVSFAVEPGRVTSLIGPNGAGKTTAFNVITGFQRPSEGEVRWDGQPISGLRPCRVAERGIVRTFQKTSVFPGLTVLDNVQTALHLRGRVGLATALLARGRVRREEAAQREDALAILAAVGLAARREELAAGLS
jgi:branched-chain amino acid transport system ATP-binding protein